MNFKVFNRVNVKESAVGMYSEWASLSPQLHSNLNGFSVLNTLPHQTGKDVVAAVVKPLASNLGITQAPEPSMLATDKQVQWSMEVICYGLSLPLTEHDIVRDCVSIYCDWLGAFHPVPKISVPVPVVDDPNLYGRKIIDHLLNLFVPRAGEGPDTINRQAVLCHRVLRTLQQVAQVSVNMTRETWETLLLFLITINDTLLAPPTVKDDVGDQLCERVLSVLFEVWLLACERCFPSPPLWKTLREQCLNWRHRIALVEQWNRVHLALTAKLIEFTFGPKYPQLKINEEDGHIIPSEMTHDCVVQCWYRFLHCLGNPVHLCRPDIISQTPKFLQFAISSDNVTDPSQHSCLSALPTIFLKAIRGIAGQVDAFLGIASANLYDEVCGDTKLRKEVGGGLEKIEKTTPTPPSQRRLAKSFSVAPAAVSKGLQKTSLIGLTSSRMSTVQPPSIPDSGPSSASSLNSIISFGGVRNPLSPDRPKCNSILHLFGNWLFEAANLGYGTNLTEFGKGSVNSAKDRKINIGVNGQPTLLSEERDTMESVSMDRYSAGKAEAIGALCRIFSAKKNGEEILPVYLARFYVSLQHGLKIPENREITDVMANILLNSSDLFRVDLDGILILLPNFVDVIELVFSDKEVNKSKVSGVSRTELRQASIQLLLSILVLPLHFQNLPLKELLSTGNSSPVLTVGQLKPRITNILVDALQAETDPANTQMLLGALLLAVFDTALVEESEIVTQPDCPSNLFSYASDTASGRSTVSSERTSFSGDSVQLTLDDNAHALFVRATCLVCHRLISSWKGDLTISLAALELLSALARVQIKDSDIMEYKRAVRWLCEYIVCQCKKPPQAHSKDLHSSIVAAFHCCSVWLVQHPVLIEDKSFLLTVLQVVELGISGSISQGKPGEPIRLKEEKELKPLSMRVRDAAESLLHIILEQVGHFPSPCGAETLSSLLDEISLLKHCNSWPGGDIDRVSACQRFKYFVIDKSIMLALLEEPLGNDQDSQPTVTVIIRGPFGRHVWTMQLRYLPRHMSGRKHQHSSNPGRPVPINDLGVKLEFSGQHFPDSVDLIPTCKADRSIPSMESLESNDKMRGLIEDQSELEEAMRRVAVANEASLPFPNPTRECQPPNPCHEFQTARLFLSHFGLLSLDITKDYMKCPLTVIDPSQSGFCSELELLDTMSSRTSDTVHLFYVRSGQTVAEDILRNTVNDGFQDSNFMEIIHALGWVVNVWQHPGWTGHLSTSWKAMPVPKNFSDDEIQQPSQYNGEHYVIYWADVSSEIAFVVPTIKVHSIKQSMVNASELADSQGWYERSGSVGQADVNKNDGGLKTRAVSLDFVEKAEPVRPGRRFGSSRHQPFNDPPTKIMLVWLESFEDSLTFPAVDLLPHCATSAPDLLQSSQSAVDVYVIYLHGLQSGVVRVKLQPPQGKTFPIPLVDGMVLPRKAVAAFVRYTAINIGRRRRLDNDGYQPPHVRRRLKVQELASKYECNVTQPQLLTSLFS